MVEKAEPRNPPELTIQISKTLQKLRERSLSELLTRKTWKRLNLYIFWQSQDVISVGLRGKHFGMWLFDANSQTEIRKLAEEGCKISENPLDLILAGERATIAEVEDKIPAFIAKYYPDLASRLPKIIKLKPFSESY